MMRDRISIFLALLALPVLIFVIYWFVSAGIFKSRVSDNLAMMAQRLVEAGENVQLSYEDLDVHGFPFAPQVTIEHPQLTYEHKGRTMRIRLDYLEIEPYGHDYERLQVITPKHGLAVDVVKGREFVYQVSVLTAPPSLMFRTPNEELRLPKRSRNALEQTRVTPDAVLKTLPLDYVHQYSLVFPSEIILGVRYGNKGNTVKYVLPGRSRANWKAIDYNIGQKVAAFFRTVVKVIHYPNKK